MGDNEGRAGTGLDIEICTSDGLLTRHLKETGGFYSRVALRLGVEKGDYQRFIDFLKHSGLKVDQRSFR